MDKTEIENEARKWLAQHVSVNIHAFPDKDFSITWDFQWGVDDEDRLIATPYNDKNWKVNGRAWNVDFTLRENIPPWLKLGYIPGHLIAASGVTSFHGFPKEIQRDLVISYCKFENFEGMPEKIGGVIWAIGSRIKSFKGYTQSTEKLKGAPDNINDIEGVGIWRLIDRLQPEE
jgi:hypothetical protein